MTWLSRHDVADQVVLGCWYPEPGFGEHWYSIFPTVIYVWGVGLPPGHVYFTDDGDRAPAAARAKADQNEDNGNNGRPDHSWKRQVTAKNGVWHGTGYREPGDNPALTVDKSRQVIQRR